VIVYLETNYLFELGLGRAQHESCRALLDWCMERRIDLRLPTFALPETHGALRRREAARADVIRGLKGQQADARRHSADPAAYQIAEDGLQIWTLREGEQMDMLTQKLLRAARFIPLDFEALEHAYRLRRLKALSGDADLFILASIIRDLELRRDSGDIAPSLFVTGDADFTKAKSHLRPFSCDLLTSYAGAVARLKGHLA
jgi:hypothetical protein